MRGERQDALVTGELFPQLRHLPLTAPPGRCHPGKEKQDDDGGEHEVGQHPDLVQAEGAAEQPGDRRQFPSKQRRHEIAQARERRRQSHQARRQRQDRYGNGDQEEGGERVLHAAAQGDHPGEDRDIHQHVQANLHVGGVVRSGFRELER